MAELKKNVQNRLGFYSFKIKEIRFIVPIIDIGNIKKQ